MVITPLKLSYNNIYVLLCDNIKNVYTFTAEVKSK